MRKSHKPFTEETLQRMRKPRSEEAKVNMKGPKSEEAKVNMKLAQNRPEVREKHSGENSSNWQGGISREPYSKNWSKALKKIVKDRDGHVCMLCFISEDKLKGELLKQGLVIKCVWEDCLIYLADESTLLS